MGLVLLCIQGMLAACGATPAASVSTAVHESTKLVLVTDTDVALDGVTLIAADHAGYIIGSHTWMEY